MMSSQRKKKCRECVIILLLSIVVTVLYLYSIESKKIPLTIMTELCLCLCLCLTFKYQVSKKWLQFNFCDYNVLENIYSRTDNFKNT
jgi:hypothetical protein